MTREEQINKEAYRQEGLVDMDVESFIAGAKWADKHPKSQWISVEDDLPCNHRELMGTKEIIEGTETIEVFATSKSGLIWIDYMIYVDGKWRWNGNYFEPNFWMLAPKPPKE